jgi:3-hydroxyisobutyrate dehydrogenase
MLFDVESVESALDEARDGLRPGATLVQMATVGVEGTSRLASLAEGLGLAFVDAPVLGSRQAADDGALVVLASGPGSARDAVQPVLDAVGSRTVWVGEAGQGTRLKLVANSWVLTVIEGIAESLTLAKALGVAPEQFLDVVRGGAMDAPYVQLKGTAMLEGDFTPAFGLDSAAKDAGLVVDAARAAGADLAVIEAVQQHFARALDAGHGHLDLAATYLTH